MRQNRVKMLIPILICFIGMNGLLLLEITYSRQLSFHHISNLCQTIIESHPEIEEQVLSSLKEYHVDINQKEHNNDFLLKYGYQSNDFNEGFSPEFILLTFIMYLIITGSFMFSIWHIDKYNKRRIVALTDYLECVNIGRFDKIIPSKEDIFSHLEDEIYKTVTALRQMKDEAIQTKENYANHLANIAHQFKTKITTLSLTLQLFKKSHLDLYLQQLENQLEGLNWLQDTLLTLSRIDAGVLQLEHSKVDIYTALILATENLNELLVEKNVSVSIPDHGCIEIDGDLEWTMEALVNIIKNCMEHSASGGMIHCEYSKNPLYVEIVIWDEGKGFKEEELSHLFERFYKRNENGIGIGLSLARSIFEMQNGNITARNMPEGGACFEIRVYSH